MYLDKEQLRILFKHFLDEYLLPRSFDHIPAFESEHRADICVNRLFFMLRENDFRHLQYGNTVCFTELVKELEKFFKSHEKIFLQGINYSFTIHDLKAFCNIYEKEFKDARN